jgi:2-dehydropantoate 2-reductase
MIDSNPMNFLIFGAGAIGSYLGGTLVQAGQKVVFIEQPAVAAELAQTGLRLDLSIDKKRGQAEPLVIPPDAFKVVTSPAEALLQGPFDLAVFAMKSYDTAAALEQVKPFAEQFPPVLCLQNGVDNEPAIAAALGPGRVIPGTVTCSIARGAPGQITLEKARGIGVVAGNPLSQRLVEKLNLAQLNAHLFERAIDMKWSKLLMNLPGSATAAILDMTPAEIYSHPGLYELEMQLSREAVAVIQAEGARVVNLPGIPVSLLAIAQKLPAFLARPILIKVVGGGRGGRMPGFYTDLHAGRKSSEVAWLHGAVARHGELLGIPTPVSRVLTDTLLAMVRGEIPIAAFSHQPEKLLALVKKE